MDKIAFLSILHSIRYLFLFLPLHLAWLNGNTQDSIPPSNVEPKKGIIADTTTLFMMDRLEKMNREANAMILSLENRVNTREIESDLRGIETDLSLARYFMTNYQEHFSYRILRSFLIFLGEIQKKLAESNNSLSRLNLQLTETGKTIINFIYDSSYHSPSDPSLRNVFHEQYNKITDLWVKADSINKKRGLQVAILQNRLSSSSIEWATLYDSLKINMDIYNKNILRADEKPLLSSSKSDYKKNIFQVGSISKQAGAKVLWYYLESRWVPVMLITLLCYCCAAWIIFIRRQYRESLRAYVKTEDIRLHYLANNPILTSLLISFNFAPFFFPHPPVVFVETVWTLIGLTVTVLFLSDPGIPVKAKITWVIFFILFRLVALDNLLLYKSYEERWLILVLNVCFIIIDVIAYRVNKRSNIFNLKRTAALIVLSIALHSISIICNLAGLFNLAKTLTIAAAFSGFTVIVLRLFLDAAKEALTFQLAFMRRNFSDENVFLRLYKIVRRLLVFFAIITWIVVFLSSLNIFDRVQESILNYLKRPVGVGNSSFTIWNVLVFIFVIWASVMLSNLVSLITEIRTKQDKKYFNLRNAKLFLKIAIITTGIFLAFVTTHIPIDRIAIILGALSVGIGFGLQNLVSNLISGVMISLEHPVRIGDTIEVGGHIGVVKEIGIRSIHVLTASGSDVIIPNSDLLSQHVVNWTLSGQQRRIELLIPVKSGVDFGKAKEIIETVLRDHKDIMKRPSPEVILSNFIKSKDGGYDAIEIDCHFWCEDQRDAARIRSGVLEDVHSQLKELDLQGESERGSDIK